VDSRTISAALWFGSFGRVLERIMHEIISPLAQESKGKVPMKEKYSYQDYEITVWSSQDFSGKWQGQALIDNANGITIYEHFPFRKFNTEAEALEDARKRAEDEVDNPHTSK
jgi:hypothetical protein